MNLLPFLISSAIGILWINFLFKKDPPPNLFLTSTLGIGLGLGLSSHLTFSSFLFFNRLMPQFVISVHLVILIALMIQRFIYRKNDAVSLSLPKPTWQNISLSVLILIVLFLVIKQGLFYPYGGWDAWQVWNFKAKFLFLSDEYWHNLFSPELWRSSPHYPLLLPLINVWGWLFSVKPDDTTPFITSVLFACLTAGLLSSALWEKTKNIFSLLPALLILTLPFYILLATTQYCDIVLSFYLLASIVALTEAQKESQKPLALLAGLLSGFLGFTKPEGLIASLILCALVLGLTLVSKLRKDKSFSFTCAGLFFFGLMLASLPTFAFNILYSPGNQTFVNGLTSTLKPSTAERFQIILIFLWLELKSAKWNGLWMLLLLGLILGGKKLWAKNFLTAAFLLLYLTVIVAYYQVNTYFEIKWWLSVSLNRILFSLLPLFLFWVFGSLLSKD
jgi:hypothetical protein